MIKQTQINSEEEEGEGEEEEGDWKVYGMNNESLRRWYANVRRDNPAGRCIRCR